MQQMTAPSRGWSVRSARSHLVCFSGTTRAELTFLAIAAHNGLPQASSNPVWKITAGVYVECPDGLGCMAPGLRHNSSRVNLESRVCI